jgi:hypothetical protein
VYFVLGIACFLAGWKLTAVSEDPAFIVSNVPFSIYDGLYVLGALCIVRGFYKWMHE